MDTQPKSTVNSNPGCLRSAAMFWKRYFLSWWHVENHAPEPLLTVILYQEMPGYNGGNDLPDTPAQTALPGQNL